MKVQRLKLQTILENLLGSDQVYFQPPENVKMQYPAIVYFRDRAVTRHADNLKYMDHTMYEVTVIDRDPDSTISEKVRSLPKCSFERSFKQDGLNHDIYSLYA
jgi:hypothetical protein